MGQIEKWESLERAWLSGQMTHAQLDQHLAENRDFARWFEARVSLRMARDI